MVHWDLLVACWLCDVREVFCQALRWVGLFTFLGNVRE